MRTARPHAASVCRRIWKPPGDVCSRAACASRTELNQQKATLCQTTAVSFRGPLPRRQSPQISGFSIGQNENLPSPLEGQAIESTPPIRNAITVVGIGKCNDHLFANFVQFFSLWARILKLFLKVFVRQLKVSVLAENHRVLLFQRRHLLREQRSLLVEKVNHVFRKPGSGGNAGKFFNGIGSARNWYLP